MKHFQICYTDEKDFAQKLAEIRQACASSKHSDILFYINCSTNDTNIIGKVTSGIESAFPDAQYYGNECSGCISQGELSYEINVACTVLEAEDSKAEIVWVEKGTPLSSLDDLWAYCRAQKGLKAVELIPSSEYVRLLQVDGNVPDLDESIFLFGGASVAYDMSPSKSGEVLANGHPHTETGLVAVLYSGEEMQFSSTYVLGWKGLGNLMKVTRSHGRIIEEINGAPAYSIYEKYLNLSIDDSDTLVFPLIMEENGVEFLRTPELILNDKSMQMLMNVPEGSMVRIAYGDKNTILESLFHKAEEIAKFSPVAIKAFSCAGRKWFWGDDEISKETRIIQQIAPVFGFYTGGEILRFGDQLRLLNQTLCITSLKETSNDSESDKPITISERTPDKSLVSRLAYFIEKVSEEQNIEHNKAIEASKAKTSFLFNMSHDIRTPMNAISGFTKMAQMYVDDKEKVVDYLKKIDISSHELLLLINEVLEMSRIESGKIEFDPTPIHLKDSLNALTTVLCEQARDKGLTFNATIGEITHNSILADKARMSQIVLNITSNAIKYTPTGGHIDFLFHENPCNRPGYGNYTFSVIDNGIGISEEFQKILFEPFEREKNSTVSKIQGTGLGLSIVKRLVDIIGGTIDVQSQVGKGTRFDINVTIPLSEEEAKHNEESKDTGAVDFTGHRILLVEDNELNREIARFILENMGFTVEEAEDGDIAVEKVRNVVAARDWDYYYAVLMDVQMPRMDGYEATRQIRAIKVPQGVHLPIIALSANAFEEDKAKSLSVGMDNHIAKPIEIDVLARALAAVRVSK